MPFLLLSFTQIKEKVVKIPVMGHMMQVRTAFTTSIHPSINQSKSEKTKKKKSPSKKKIGRRVKCRRVEDAVTWYFSYCGRPALIPEVSSVAPFRPSGCYLVIRDHQRAHGGGREWRRRWIAGAEGFLLASHFTPRPSVGGGGANSHPRENDDENSR